MNNTTKLTNIIAARRDTLAKEMEAAFSGTSIKITAENDNVLVLFHDLLICGVAVDTDVYKVYNVSNEWKEQTTYLCEFDENGKLYYYIDSVGEVIGEIGRLVKFEVKRRVRTPIIPADGNFEMARQILHLLKASDYIEPYMFSENDVVEGKSTERKKVSLARFNDIRTAIIFLYVQGGPTLSEKVVRDTYFELKVTKGNYRLFCADILCNYLRTKKGLEIKERHAKWVLKNEFCFGREQIEEVVQICQALIDDFLIIRDDENLISRD